MVFFDLPKFDFWSEQKTSGSLYGKLARSAASKRMLGPEPFFAVGPHTIKELIRNEETAGREKYEYNSKACIMPGC